MSFHVIMCTDKEALLSSGAVDAEGPYRGLIDGKSGAYVLDNADATMSMIVMTDITGVEALAQLPFILVTSYEEVLGYQRQVTIDDIPQFGEPILTVVPSYYESVVVGYEDGDPIYRVERVVTETTREVTDEDGNTFEVAGRPIITYVTTTDIEGYEQVAVYGTGDLIPEQTITTPNPIMEDIAGDVTLKAIYDEIYPRTPVTGEDSNTSTPPALFAVPGGQDVSHILVGQS
jgi:hypothetical protein